MYDIAIGFAAFIGFAIGRVGDKYFGYLEWIGFLPVPHHWMPGIILILIAFFLLHKYKNKQKILAYCLIAFGIGLFASDLNDFLHFRFLGEEPPHIWRFWSIE